MASFESRLAAEDLLHGFCQRAAAAGDRAELGRVLEAAYEADGLYAFGELLDVAPVQRCPELQTKLRLFAYGCCRDVPAALAAGAAPLTPKQLVKLQELTLASLVRDRREKTVPYSAIQDALGVTDVRAFEDIIIDAIYHRLCPLSLSSFFADCSRAVCVCVQTWLRASWTRSVARSPSSGPLAATCDPSRSPLFLQPFWSGLFPCCSFIPLSLDVRPNIAPHSRDRQKRCSALVDHADKVVREGGVATAPRATDPSAMSDAPVATN